MILRVPTQNDRPDGLSDAGISDLALTFKTLGDETRLRIVLHISRHGRAHVSDLCDLLELSQPLVSHHLALLRSAGVVEMHCEGRHHFYSMNAERFAQLMKTLSFDQGCEAPCDRFLECVFK